MMANIKLNPFLMIVNLRPNLSFSMGKVTTPTIVSVVKNAAPGTILAPKLMKEPTSGNATNAGIKVMLPKSAPINVALTGEDSPKYVETVSGGKYVRIRPIKKMMLMMLGNINLTLFFDFLNAFFVFSLSLMTDIISKVRAMAQKISVNISI